MSCSDRYVPAQVMLNTVVSTHVHVAAKGTAAAVQQMELLPPLHAAWMARALGSQRDATGCHPSLPDYGQAAMIKLHYGDPRD